MSTSVRLISRQRRQARVRRRVRGTDVCPRLCVFRSNRHIYAQVISDEGGKTLVSASSAKSGAGGNREAARKVGEEIARLCREKKIEKVVFDRNGFLFHGRVREVAEGARAAGLQL